MRLLCEASKVGPLCSERASGFNQGLQSHALSTRDNFKNRHDSGSSVRGSSDDSTLDSCVLLKLSSPLIISRFAYTSTGVACGLGLLASVRRCQGQVFERWAQGFVAPPVDSIFKQAGYRACQDRAKGERDFVRKLSASLARNGLALLTLIGSSKDDPLSERWFRARSNMCKQAVMI